MDQPQKNLYKKKSMQTGRKISCAYLKCTIQEIRKIEPGVLCSDDEALKPEVKSQDKWSLVQRPNNPPKDVITN